MYRLLADRYEELRRTICGSWILRRTSYLKYFVHFSIYCTVVVHRRWFAQTDGRRQEAPTEERLKILRVELVGKVAICNSNVDVYYSVFHLKTFILFHNWGDRRFMWFKQCAKRSIYWGKRPLFVCRQRDLTSDCLFDFSYSQRWHHHHLKQSPWHIFQCRLLQALNHPLPPCFRVPEAPEDFWQ